MTKSCYGYRINGAFYCLKCPMPAVAGSGNREATVDEAHERCRSCVKTLREVVEELDQENES